MARTATVYRSALNNWDSTNGGVSSKFDQLLVVANGEKTTDSTAVRIVQRSFGNRVIFHAEPVFQDGRIINGMAGGNFLFIDSIIVGMYPEYPELDNFYGAIAIHDRSETQEQYNRMSN